MKKITHTLLTVSYVDLAMDKSILSRFFWLTVYIDLVLSVQIRNVNDTIMANIKTAAYYNMQLMNCTVLCSCCLS